MKNTKIIYWVTTSIFAAFMTFTAIPDIIMVKEAVDFITKLGYPSYFIPFIGVAKVLGSIAIMIPQFKKIKEWAYAGLVFDLIGATYSNIIIFGFKIEMIMMLVIFVFVFVSYYYNDKYYNDKTTLNTKD